MASHQTTINQARAVLTRANRNLLAMGGSLVQFNKALIAAASDYAVAHVLWQAPVKAKVTRGGGSGTVTLANHGMVTDQFFILGSVPPDRMSSNKEARFAGGYRVESVPDSAQFTFTVDGYGTNESIDLHRPDTSMVLSQATSAISGLSWTMPPDYTYYETGINLPVDTLRNPLLNTPIVGPELGMSSSSTSWLFNSNAMTQLAELRLLSVQGLNYVYSTFLQELRKADTWSVLRFALSWYQDLKRIGLYKVKLDALMDLATDAIAVETDQWWKDFYASVKTFAAKFTMTRYLPSLPGNNPPIPYTPVATLMAAVQDFYQYQLEAVTESATAPLPTPIVSKMLPASGGTVPIPQDC
jgi:hypothetical protein